MAANEESSFTGFKFYRELYSGLRCTMQVRTGDTSTSLLLLPLQLLRCSSLPDSEGSVSINFPIMYWPSGGGGGPLDSMTTSPSVSSYSISDVTGGGEQTRIALPSPMSLWSSSSAGSSYDTSDLLLKSSIPFSPFHHHQQQATMEQSCCLHSSAGDPEPPVTYGIGEYANRSLGVDIPWPVVSMVPAVGRRATKGRCRESGIDSADTDGSLVMDLSKPQRKRTGGRRPKEESMELTPEEEEKRRLRRLRNKEAAARCRRRRLEHMCRLENEVEDLLAQRDQLQEEIDALHQEKTELEVALENHLPRCHLPCGGESPSDDGLLNVGVATTSYNSDDTAVLSMQAVRHESNKSPGSDSPTESFLVRPKSLGIIRLGTTPDMPMETPSKIFLFDPLRIPTGMTPVTHKEVDPILNAASGYMHCRMDDEDDRPSSSSSSASKSKALVTL
ncbi:Transcription factor kayak [Trichuris trichiura]|uniref:Transcription factor kayak n=1 Tax=Trichuris trichiura TaxID=36087 RepID=A0A077Z5K5_TRITR|nr:Transcription factor kayak [Trichuris trichiura]